MGFMHGKWSEYFYNFYEGTYLKCDSIEGHGMKDPKFGFGRLISILDEYDLSLLDASSHEDSIM